MSGLIAVVEPLLVKAAITAAPTVSSGVAVLLRSVLTAAATGAIDGLAHNIREHFPQWVQAVLANTVAEHENTVHVIRQGSVGEKQGDSHPAKITDATPNAPR